MKKKAVLLAVILFLFVQTYGFAQDQAVAETVLPQLLDAVPDPAEILGTVGSLYQENYAFNGMNYSAYLFPKPFSAVDTIILLMKCALASLLLSRTRP